MMKKSFSLLAVVVLSGNVLFAQSVEQGKKMFYYERYTSAKENFQKVVEGNPGNTEAVYWLGQTLFKLKDSVGAQKLYQDALAKSSSDPLLLVAAGHSDLKFGKTAEARQKFETAITASKGRSVDIYNAIGRANVDSKLGDADYAIDKLKAATLIKKFNDPETYVLMGDAYRKKTDGGHAITSYSQALAIDGSYAAAKYKEGKLYQTQGETSADLYVPAFESAISKDAGFKPAYYELFYHWYSRDLNKASEYFAKYEQNADRDANLEYTKLDLAYVKGEYAAAKQKALELTQSMGDKVSPRMYRMAAFASDTLGQPEDAKKYIETFFAEANEDAPALPTDYLLLAKTDLKLGDTAAVLEAIKRGDALDADKNDKIKFLNEASAFTAKNSLKAAKAYVQGMIYRAKETPSNRDLYDYGYAYYQAGMYDSSYAIFNTYIEKYPTESFGYLWSAYSANALDDDEMSKGLAYPAWNLFVTKMEELNQVNAVKDAYIRANFILAQYEVNVSKEYQKALDHFNKVLAVDSANENAVKFKEVVENIIKNQKGK
jgi:predicted Zn-dependent protease